MDSNRIEMAVKELLEALGEDTNREGLLDTPSRVARMYEEVLAGYNDNPAIHLGRTFDEEGSDVVIEKDIDFSSTCEHHLMPFFGKVHIAYIPNGKVVGISKLARTVDVYAKRLQLQERMNNQIADAIMEHLSPKGVAVVVEGEHTCMTARGVKKVGAKTVTYAIRGDVPSYVVDLLFSK
jgi:GTP cyclohydrolase I